MPSIRSTVLLALTLALSSIDLCAAKNCSNTCTDIHMAGYHSLVATCTAFKGNKKTSKLDLNHCFGNDNGSIVPTAMPSQAATVGAPAINANFVVFTTGESCVCVRGEA
ncbi:hypothetical protein BDV19DRAFT_388071 [Aspergillus venezuelensis]